MAYNELLGLIALVAMIWVIYDVAMVNKKLDKKKKVIWIVCAVFFNIITAVVYYIMEKR